MIFCDHSIVLCDCIKIYAILVSAHALVCGVVCRHLCMCASLDFFLQLRMFIYVTCGYVYVLLTLWVCAYMLAVCGFPPPPHTPQCDDPAHTTHCSNDYMAAALLL